MKQSLRHCIENGIPYSDLHEMLPKNLLKTRVRDAEEACTAAHCALYDAAQNNSKKAVVIDDEYSGEKAKYVTFAAKDGSPCYRLWKAGSPATDIGMRGINPNFTGRANQTTIIHADSDAYLDFAAQGAPAEMLDAIGTVASLNRFVVSQAVKPFLSEVARLYGLDPKSYQRIFYPLGQRAMTLTRVIMYHCSPAQERYTGSDGEELLIREHYDQSSWSVDMHQTSPGLQYQVSGDWLEADTNVAVFRGAGDDFLPSTTPGALHRAVRLPEQLSQQSSAMREAKVRRIAYVAFVSPSVATAHVVQPSSTETHPDPALSIR